MGFRKYIGIFFFFTLITSTVFGYVPENSRQGFSPISAESQPGQARGDEELHQGSGQESTTFASGSMFGFDHDGWWYGRHFAKVLTPFLFQGRRWDGFSNTYNHRWRQYAPKYGRWISRDPISFEGGLNLYAYVNNNPLAFTDPFGLSIAQAIQLLERNPELSSYKDLLILANQKIQFRKIREIARNLIETPAVRFLISDDDLINIYAEIMNDSSYLSSMQISPIPAFVNDKETFDSWLEIVNDHFKFPLQKMGKLPESMMFSSTQINLIIQKAKEFCVPVTAEIHSPHMENPQNPWKVGHIKIGTNEEWHIPVPSGFNMPAAEK